MPLISEPTHTGGSLNLRGQLLNQASVLLHGHVLMLHFLFQCVFLLLFI